jgi:hypothetical protein
MEFENIVKKLYEKIIILTFLNCQGCQEYYPSLKKHFCCVTDWNTLVHYFLDIAVQEIPDANKFTKEEIFVAICEYGSSYDREAKEFY